ncbi:MarR family winged helix-turn-helix transcriptional regulator [Sanguibacter sp. HDW7]|uniref:MarR family winged helix-turn-helix transcriptional regulator n=1 Tax=Sanguibacter sp. HDW7 TaxID=2714931 RepID=UPI0014095E7A|nr:MarR family winged helix-turn-helix transcriptional regulator [Sanguibacter sp. HDW7]QIK82532.1 winged helix-turn-helix transcriptional regulator [Sanguibacter sp. HDW7]
MTSPSMTESGRVVVALHELLAAVDAGSERLLRASSGHSLATVTFLSILADAQRTAALDGATDPTDLAPTGPWVRDLTTLADCLGVTRAAVSKRVPTLVEQGLVLTSADPRHARRVRLALTVTGAAVVADATARLDAWLAGDLAGRLDLPALHAALTAAIAALAP